MAAVDAPPVLAADLTFVKVDGGRAYANLANWDEDTDPYEGQHVLAADGGSERMEAIVTEIRPDGTLVLTMPAYAKPLRVAG